MKPILLLTQAAAILASQAEISERFYYTMSPSAQAASPGRRLSKWNAATPPPQNAKTAAKRKQEKASRRRNRK